MIGCLSSSLGLDDDFIPVWSIFLLYLSSKPSADLAECKFFEDYARLSTVFVRVNKLREGIMPRKLVKNKRR